MEHQSTTSTSSHVIPEGVLSPTGTGKTPLPVVANWFDALEAKMSRTKPVRNEQIDTGAYMIPSDDKTCSEQTTSFLNEILDELVIDESAIEFNESSTDTGTMKRKENKNISSDEADNRSVKSDATVIEMKDKEESVIVVPPSPKEIRKKFQSTSSFERGFTKSADLELSKEFKEGMKGKVKESRDNFLRQTVSDSKVKEASNRKEEMEEIKLFRTLSQNKEDNEESKAELMKQEKLRELEAVKRSRSRSRAKDEESVNNSYLKEKHERELELIQLANRNTNMSWESENKELQMREERNRELAELVNRPINIDSEGENEMKRKEMMMKEERNKELSFLSNRKIEHHNLDEDRTKMLREERKKELDEISNRKADHGQENKEIILKESILEEQKDMVTRATIEEFDLEQSQQIWNERAEELKQIASMRSKSPWKADGFDSPVMERKKPFDSPELKGKVKHTAAAWKEREKEVKTEKEIVVSKELPTRRIGSLFKRDSDYWNLNDSTDEFPEPPSEAEIAQTSPTLNPPPPLRQSSKGKIEEYTRDPNWNAPWRKS